MFYPIYWMNGGVALMDCLSGHVERMIHVAGQLTSS